MWSYCDHWFYPMQSHLLANEPKDFMYQQSHIDRCIFGFVFSQQSAQMANDIANPAIVLDDIGNRRTHFLNIDRFMVEHTFDSAGVVHDRCQGLTDLMRESARKFSNGAHARKMNEGVALAIDLRLHRHTIAHINQCPTDKQYAALVIGLQATAASKPAHRFSVPACHSNVRIEGLAGLAAGGNGTAKRCQVVRLYKCSHP